MSITVKNGSGSTVTIPQLATTPHGDGKRTLPAQTQASPIQIQTVIGAQRAVQTVDGTFILHPTGR